jgi:hypothetical protein
MGRDIEKRCKKVRDDLLGSSHGDERSLLGKLLDSSVSDIIAKVFEHCQVMFQPRPREKVNTFLSTIISDKLFRGLFSLAIHKGCKDILKDILEDCKAVYIEEIENSRGKEAASKPPDKSKYK